MIRNIIINIKTSGQIEPAQKLYNVLSFNSSDLFYWVHFFFLFQTICKTRNKDYLVIKREINVYMDKNAHSFNYMHFILN